MENVKQKKDELVEFNRIEEKLANLCKQNKRNWANIASILIKIDSNNLWETGSDREGNPLNSYSAWLRNFSSKYNFAESYLWELKRTGKTYLDYAKEEGINLEESPLEEVSCDVKALDIAQKVKKIDHAKGTDLMAKVLAGEASRKDAQAEYRAINWTARAARNKKKYENIAKSDAQKKLNKAREDGYQYTEESVLTLCENKAAEYISFVQDTNKTSRGNVKFSDRNYLNFYTQFPMKTGTSRHARQIDGMIVTNWSKPHYEKRYETDLIGIEVKVSLHDMISDDKMDEYKDFCNYFYLAIPPYEEMIKAAETDFPSDTGILVCDCENNEIKVIRKATRQNPRHISQAHAVAIFKQSV